MQTTFTISPTLNKNKVFILNRREIEKRFDPFYYVSSLVELERKVLAKHPKKLRDYVVALSSGATPKRDEEEKYYSDADNGIPFLRVQNVTEFGLDLSDVKYINKETHEGYLKRSQVFENDLLVTITGRIASASVAPKDFEGNINQHSVVIKTESKEASEILACYLNSSVGQKLALRNTTGGTRPALDYPALLSIPIIYDKRILGITKKVVELKKRNEVEAENILGEIDKYLMKELGIILPAPPENILKNRIYKTSIKEISGNRLDPYYFSKYFFEIYKSITAGKYPAKSISSITANIDTGRTPSRDSYVKDERENKIPIVKAGSYTGDFIDFSKCDYTAMDFKGNETFKSDIFILGAAHQAEYVGKKVYYLNEEPKTKTFFVGELVRITVNPLKYDNSLLFSILKTKIYSLLLNREKRGQTSHLYPDDVKHILIPLPPLAKQKEIAGHITDIRKQAQQLKDKTKEELKKASEEIEKILLT